MVKPQPITPERILAEIEQAALVSQLSITVSGPKFKVMLGDESFARSAHELVVQKLAKIEAGDYKYAKGAGSERNANKSSAELGHRERHD